MADEAFLLICHIPDGTPTIKKKKEKKKTKPNKTTHHLTVKSCLLQAMLEQHEYRRDQIFIYLKAKNT